MNDTTHDPPDPPEDHPEDVEAGADQDQLFEEQVLSADTLPEGVEHLGDGFANLDDYFRAELEEHIAPPIHWILKHLDMKAICDRFEAGRFRYLCESGSVYRVALPEV
jgi:hypothetical protein